MARFKQLILDVLKLKLDVTYHIMLKSLENDWRMPKRVIRQQSHPNAIETWKMEEDYSKRQSTMILFKKYC